MKKILFILLVSAAYLYSADIFGQTRRYPAYRSRYYGRRTSNISQNTPDQTPNNNSSNIPKDWRNLTAEEQRQIDQCRSAIHLDDLDLLKKSLGDNLDINIKNSEGETLLNYAVKERRMNCLRYLLEKKADVNIPGQFEITPLFLCSRDNDAKLADLLMRAGARTFYKDKNSQWTVFHKAAAENMGLDTLAVLMRDKSGLNLKDRHGRTPLHLAVSRAPHAEYLVVEFLLKNGADVNALDEQGRTPLDLTKQKDIVNLLLRYHGRYNKKKGSSYRKRR